MPTISPPTSKRRLVSLLPQCNQTDDLQTFFGATVDELFQPGSVESISGFIGHRFPGTTDFYVGEPTASRTFYQLEPGMVSYDTIDTNHIAYALTYPDLVAYLDVRGANTTDHQRLFDSDYYAWAPPINIDMLMNYRKYYWFGDVALSTQDSYTFNPNDKSVDVTLSNGLLTADSPGASGGTPSGVRSTPLAGGSWYIELTLHSGAEHVVGLANILDALNPGAPGTQNNTNAVIYNSDGQVFSVAGLRTLTPFTTGATVAIAWSTLNRKVWFRVGNGPWDNVTADDPSSNLGGFDINSLLSNGAACVYWAGFSNDCKVTINFGASPFSYAPPTGFVGPATVLQSAEQPALVLDVPISLYTGNGATTSFALPASIRCVPSADEQPTAYVNNVAVAATLSLDGLDLNLTVPPASGTTVMTCRTPDLAAMIDGLPTVDVSDLNTQEVTTLTSTMRIEIIDAIHIINAWDVQPWDAYGWDAAGDATYMVDGIGLSLRLTPLAAMIRGLRAQYVTIDRSSRDQNQWSVRNFWVHSDAFTWSGQNFPERQASRPIIEFVRDIVIYPAQTWSDSADPLFMLYDLDDRALNDPSYRASTFEGNRIFGYATGNSPVDTVLSRSVKTDSNGYFVFNNDADTVQYTYLLGINNPISTPFIGLNLYATDDGSTRQYHAFWLLTATPTTQVLDSSGFYPIPSNLSANPDYAEVTQMSRSQWQNHFTSIITNQLDLVGVANGSNNYRDTLRDLSLGNAIVQHVAPMLKVMLLASEVKFDLTRVIRYAELEYNRFRNKFARKLVDLSSRGVLDPSNDAATLWVSTVLDSLKIGHTASFPFALSAMAGGQYFIAPTPTALGILPSAVPALVTDTSSGHAIQLLLGHDGSLSPTFGDWRDTIMLALETQIYQNLPSTFRSDSRPEFDIARWLGGFFYTPPYGYTWSEFTAVISPFFELWAQINRLDYRTNNAFDPDDAFTWNFRDVADRSGQPLPGNWRAIYHLYYGTDAPQTRPWEMLGFTGQPTWWVARYGAAPYGRSNTLLWGDLAAGLIAAGPRQGTDPIYARPGLAQIIPVDQAGNLLDPVAAGIVTTRVPEGYGSRPWQAGDHGPIENLWQKSPAYRFALTLASFLLKPARFVEQCWDALNIGMVNAQWVEIDTHTRPRNATLYMHGEINPTLTPPTTVTVLGLSQWISDYLVSIGQTSALLGKAVRGLDVVLMHPMAGFTAIGFARDNVRLVADSFGLLPSEDVQVILYASPSIASEAYSGVIIEWTGQFWRVLGYDGRNPFFTIIPPNTMGQRGLISLANASEPAIVAWASGTYYPVGILAAYQNSVYEAIRSHTSGSVFEQNFWQARPDLATAMIRAPRVVTYVSGLDTTVRVPYGSEFYNYQDIANFLLGWERWLVSRGWSFQHVDPTSGNILNWSLSVKEFLTWAQIQWAPGNFVALSPGQSYLQFTAAQGTILNVEDNVTGFYGLTNRVGQPIDQRATTISRLDGMITITANNADIFLARLEISNIEHALVPSNVTIFDDNVYLPLYNMRQERLRLTCDRVLGWTGRLDAPGYIVVNGANTLASNFEQTATDIGHMFDIELANSDILRDYARHNVGMQVRTYLNNLLLSNDAQFEMYQGMIQEKGAPGVFQSLARNSLASNNSTLQFLEEWAFRVGRFGAPLDAFVTFQLSQSDVRNDPQYVRFNPLLNAPLDWIQFQGDDSRWFDKPTSLTQFFDENSTFDPTLLPTAGPVRLNEVNNAVFHIDDVPGLYDPTSNVLPTGSRTWVYEADLLFEGTNWYVNAATGNDQYSGTSLTNPFQSLQRAHDVSNPGDVINIAAGIYFSPGLGTNVLEITRSGIASAPIRYQAMPGTLPLIVGMQSIATIHVNAASYIILAGLELAGWNSQLVLTDVQALVASGGSIPDRYNGIGITVDRGQSSVLSHHITIRDCIVHDFPNSGIEVRWGDYITVQNCTVYNNTQFSPLAGSGIHIVNSHNLDGNTPPYKTFVQQNICYGNINLIPNNNTGTISDGNGISIDGNLNDLTDGIGYSGRTLVENNLCYNNGGNGILVNDCAHVDVIFNTAYMNQNNTTRAIGEIVVFYSQDSNVYNNIMVAIPAVPLATDLANNADVIYSNNLCDGGNGSPVPGVALHSDPLFVAPTRSIPDFHLRRGSFGIAKATPIPAAGVHQTTLDQAGNLRSAETGYDLGCYQSANAIPAPMMFGRHPYTVLQSFETTFTGLVNSLLVITTPNEDPTLISTRLSFQYTMAIFDDDIGNYLIIDGLSQSNPELAGLQVITAVHTALNSVDIAIVGNKGNSFLSDLISAPSVRVLRPVRFTMVETIPPTYNFNIGDLVWVDRHNEAQWAVLQWTGTSWILQREQPHRIKQTTIGETVIYSAGAQINGQQMLLNRPLVDDLPVIDPPSGFICNISDREIEFRTEFDPARYNAGFAPIGTNIWGPNEVGKVWWNLATCRFLDVFTDTLGVSNDRDLAELDYRVSYWAQVAPNCSVDVYEWVESKVDPQTYTLNTLPGTVYNNQAPSYVQRSVFDPVTRNDTTLYYFWVTGLTTVPNQSSRHNSVSTVALGIENPMAVGIAWMGAVSTDSLLVSGVRAALDETTSVMKVRLIENPENVGHHDQWLLMRPGDATSLPTAIYWDAVRDGLTGFAVTRSNLISVPDPALPLARNTGIDRGQSLFTVGQLSVPPWIGLHPYFLADQVSLAGFAYVCTTPGISSTIGPSGFSSTINDGTVQWAYRGPDGSRTGLLDARAAFVGSVNNVLAATPINTTRSAVLATLRRTTPIDSYLVWSESDASYPFEPAPSNEWDQPWAVYSLSERNDLLGRVEFAAALKTNTPISVLLNGYANVIPQWSIWIFDPVAATRIIIDNPGVAQTSLLIANADLVFNLKTAYEYTVQNETDRNALIGSLVDGDRVLVLNDTQNFWAIYRWQAPAFDFVLWRVQTYDTSNFIDDVDWYAPGYGTSNPPVISYATTTARNTTEGPVPTNRFVKVLDDGSGNFIWTAFVDNNWSIVAIENGSVQLSANFYDPLRPVFAVSTLSMPNLLAPSQTLSSNIVNRDGSWELRVLIHALRYTGFLLDAEVNQIWFDIVNYVHVQQNEVDWAFKTSFMTLSGIAVPLQQAPVLTSDQTQNVIDFIEEIKPYRVKVRDLAIQYNPIVDTGNTSVTDFDNLAYTDPITGLPRDLDPTNPVDILILQTKPYVDWYNNYLLPHSPVRAFNITLLFDRIADVAGNWDMSPWDSTTWDSGEGSSAGAAYRILINYAPTPGMPPVDLTLLLGLASKTDLIYGLLTSSFSSVDDGGTLVPESYATDLNPAQTSQPGGFDLRDPYVAANSPEERVPFGADDGLQLIVTAKPLAGAPPQIIKVFEVGTLTGSTCVLFYDLISRSATDIMVFCDGVRAVLGTDYTVDHLARSITLNLTVNSATVHRAAIHVFGFGGNSLIPEQEFYSYGSNALTLNTLKTTAGSNLTSSNLLVVVNGSPVATSGYSLGLGSVATVSLVSPPSNGSDVALVVYDGGNSTATAMQTQTLAYTISQVWTLSQRDTATAPEHAGTIVEVNGLRLSPPITVYGAMTVATPYVYLAQAPDVTTTVTVFVNNIRYTTAIPVCTTTSASSPYPFNVVLPGSPPPTNIAGQFVLFGNLLIALDATFISSNVVVVLQFVGSVPDYTVSSGVLTINKALISSDVIVVTTFANAACMGIQTVAFTWNANLLEAVVPQPVSNSYALVTMNGMALQPDDDYRIVLQSFSLDNVYFTQPVLQINNPVINANVVATIFTGAAARETMIWQYSTRTPAFVRMIPAMVTVQSPTTPSPTPTGDGFDVAVFDLEPFDETQLQAIPTNGSVAQPQFVITDKFELARLSPYMAGTLIADLGASDSTFAVALFVQPLATKLRESNPLPVPDISRNRPGVIWIEGERIEYFSYTRSSDTVTLGALRRGTRGTSMGAQRLVRTATGIGSDQSFTFTGATGVLTVTVNGVGQPASVLSVVVTLGNTVVTLTAAIGSHIVVGLTVTATHRAGATVWNGAMTFQLDVPIGPTVGNRELQPMHQIING